MTLRDYADAITGAKCLCGHVFGTSSEIGHYAHSSGWRVEGLKEHQWLSTICPRCTGQVALWKLGVAGLADGTQNEIALRIAADRKGTRESQVVRQQPEQNADWGGPATQGFQFRCHACGAIITCAVEQSGHKSECLKCGVALVAPSRIQEQIRMFQALPRVDFSPAEVLPHLFTRLDTRWFYLLLSAQNLRPYEFDYVVDERSQEVQLPGSHPLLVEPDGGDRTHSIPLGPGRNILGRSLLRYTIVFVKRSQYDVYGMAVDDSRFRALTAAETKGLLRAVLQAAKSGKVELDKSEPVSGSASNAEVLGLSD